MQRRLPTIQVVGAILMVLAVLVLSAVPAFGQTQGDDAQYNAVCQNIIGQIGDTTQANTATQTVAAAEQYSKAVGVIAQEAGVSIEQINECLNGADLDGDVDKDLGDVDSKKGVLSASVPDVKSLVNTGGIPLLAGAGMLLVAAIAVGLMLIGRR